MEYRFVTLKPVQDQGQLQPLADAQIDAFLAAWANGGWRVVSMAVKEQSMVTVAGTAYTPTRYVEWTDYRFLFERDT